MQNSLDALKVALRVLSACTERRQADPSDLDNLRQYAPDSEKLPPDELACEVIQRALKARAIARGTYPSEPLDT